MPRRDGVQENETAPLAFEFAMCLVTNFLVGQLAYPVAAVTAGLFAPLQGTNGEGEVIYIYI